MKLRARNLPFGQLLTFIFSLSLVCAFTLQGYAMESISFVKEIRTGLKEPVAIAIADHGQMYILDKEQGKVLIATPEGAIKGEFAQRGSKSGDLSKPSAIALLKSGEVIVADTGNSRVQVYSKEGKYLYALGNYGFGRGEFIEPRSVAVDPVGFIYIGDTSKKTISKFTPNGVFLEEQSIEYKPMNIVFDIQRNMYVLSNDRGKIIKYAIEAGTMKEISFYMHNRNYIEDALAITVDARGDIYFVERNKHTIKKIDQNENLLFSFGSKGNAKGQFSMPEGILAAGNDRIYIADSKNGRIQIFDMQGSENMMLSKLEFSEPMLDFDVSLVAEETIVDLDVAPKLGLYALSDRNAHVLFKGNDSALFEKFTRYENVLSNPKGLHVMRDGQMLIADTGNDRLQFLNSEGAYEYHFGKKGSRTSEFNDLSAAAVDAEGRIYVADRSNHRIQVFNHDGIYLSTLDTDIHNENSGDVVDRLTTPASLVFNSMDHLHVLDLKNKRVLVYAKDGTFLRQIGGEADANNKFSLPVDIDIDENDYLYVADRGDYTVKVVDPLGQPVIEFGSKADGPSYFPRLSSVAASSGKIYVADYEVDQIKVFRFNPHSVTQTAKNESIANPRLSTGDYAEHSMKNQKMASAKIKEDKQMQQMQERVEQYQNIVVDQKEAVVVQAASAVKKADNQIQIYEIEVNPEDVRYTAYVEEEKLFINMYATPSNNVEILEGVKYKLSEASTLNIARAKLVDKFGVQEDDLMNSLTIVSEEMTADGEFKLTISLPKGIILGRNHVQKLSRTVE